MDIFNYALQFEKDGEQYYHDAADRVTDPNLKRILTFLSQEEQKHYQMIKDLKESSREHPKSIFISDIQNIFSNMKQNNEYFTDERSSVLDILEQALVAEQDSINYYKSKQEEVDDEKAKQLLGVLKKQEDAHYTLLSSLIEYYDRPDLWLENAEFTQLKEY